MIRVHISPEEPLWTVSIKQSNENIGPTMQVGATMYEALLRLTVANTVGTTCTKRVACTHSHSSRLAKMEHYALSENRLLLRCNNDLMTHDDGNRIASLNSRSCRSPKSHGTLRTHSGEKRKIDSGQRCEGSLAAIASLPTSVISHPSTGELASYVVE